MITPQDVERLSNYLDQQLSPAEKIRLEARLKQEPELQTALADLQVTVRLLRSLPTLKPPRNFTLSATQVAKLPQRQSIFFKLRLATAMATLMFATVVGGDVLFSLSVGLRAAAPAPMGGAAKMETTEATDGLSVAQDSYAATEELMMADATLATSSPEAAIGETNLPEVGFSPPAATEVSTDERTLAYTATLTETPPAVPSSTPVSVAESTTLTSPEEAENQSAPTLPNLPPSPVPFLRYTEVGLGALVVLLAVAAWLTRKG